MTIRNLCICLTALFLLPLQGCLTYHWAKSNGKRFHVKQEFRPQFIKGRNLLIEGTSDPSTRVMGQPYLHLTFPNVLRGGDTGRLLSIWLPHDERTSRVMIEESHSKHTSATEGQAFLTFKMKGRSGTAFLQAGKGLKDSDPAKFLKDHFGYTLREVRYPVSLCALDLSQEYAFVLQCFTWKRYEGRPLVTAYHRKFKHDNWDQLDTIQWGHRSRGYFVLRAVAFAGLIPLDIVTLPVQMIGFLFYMHIVKP